MLKTPSSNSTLIISRHVGKDESGRSPRPSSVSSQLAHYQYQLPPRISYHEKDAMVNIPIIASHDYSPLSGLSTAMSNLSIETPAQPSESPGASNPVNTIAIPALSPPSSPTDQLQTPADSSDDEGKPPSAVPCAMVRKKSGEVVRPALRDKRRSSSAPGTPVYNKNVHFDANLEQIRHFLRLDKPTAVSAETSPTEEHCDERGEPTKFPFDFEKWRGNGIDWDARIVNFPAHPDDRRAHAPVRLERVFPSSDNRSLIGVVYVANLAYQKHVAARFTLDHWKTTSEVISEYNPEPRRRRRNCVSSPNYDGDKISTPCGSGSWDLLPRLQGNNYDRFDFSISLGDQPNLQSRQLLVCIRYLVNGQEYWDNNDRMNYIINFSLRPHSRFFDGCSPSPVLRDEKQGPRVPRSKRSATFPRRKSHSTGRENESKLWPLEQSSGVVYGIPPSHGHDAVDPDQTEDGMPTYTPLSALSPSPNGIASPLPVRPKPLFSQASRNALDADGVDGQKPVSPDESSRLSRSPVPVEYSATQSTLEKPIQERRSEFQLPPSLPLISAYSQNGSPDESNGYSQGLSEDEEEEENKSACSLPASEASLDLQRPARLPQLFRGRYDFFPFPLVAPVNLGRPRGDDYRGALLESAQSQRSSLSDFGAFETTTNNPKHLTELVSMNPNHKSAAYQELVERFCFYGSNSDADAPTSPGVYNNHYDPHHGRTSTAAATTPAAVAAATTAAL